MSVRARSSRLSPRCVLSFPPGGLSTTETDQFPQVNPDIKGGLIVEIGDRTIDLSVSAKLAKMNKLLQDTL